MCVLEPRYSASIRSQTLYQDPGSFVHTNSLISTRRLCFFSFFQVRFGNVSRSTESEILAWTPAPVTGESAVEMAYSWGGVACSAGAKQGGQGKNRASIVSSSRIKLGAISFSSMSAFHIQTYDNFQSGAHGGAKTVCSLQLRVSVPLLP